jgi:hypothetical protein
MSEKQRPWTPGPWRWDGCDLIHDSPTGRQYIATDGSDGGEHGPVTDSSGPDARLMAAAPELFEALEALRKEVERWAVRYDIGHEGSNLLEVMADADVALKKALPREANAPEGQQEASAPDRSKQKSEL